MKRCPAILIIVVLFCGSILNAALNDKNATSFEILTYLKNWGSLLLSPTEDTGIRTLIALDPKTLRFISPYAKEYKDLAKSETGKVFIETSSQLKTYLYGSSGKEVWVNKTADYWITAFRDPENNWNFRIFDGKEIFRAQLVNAKLSENLTDFYIPWNDTSNCPLKILAYHLDLKGEAGSSAGLIVQNTTNKEIVRLKGTIDFLDHKNKPVLLENNANPVTVNCKVSVPASVTGLVIDIWGTEKKADFHFIRPAITEIQYNDGMVWQN